MCGFESAPLGLVSELGDDDAQLRESKLRSCSFRGDLYYTRYLCWGLFQSREIEDERGPSSTIGSGGRGHDKKRKKDKNNT